MARTFLRHIRVASVDELKQRILKGIEEMNTQPVCFQWKKSGAKRGWMRRTDYAPFVLATPRAQMLVGVVGTSGGPRPP
jgi:hypothetical protein